VRFLAMLHAYVPFHGAGAETMTHSLLRHLVQSGHQCDVILSRVDPAVRADYVIDGVNVHVHTGKSQSPTWLSSAKTRPNAIVTHLENTLRAAVLGKTFRVPVIQVLHNDRPETLNSTLRHRFAMVVANSVWLARTAVTFGAELDAETFLPPRVLQIRPPVDPGEYAGKPGSHVTLVNLTVAKGAHVFYELAARLPQYQFLGVMGAYGVQMVRRDVPNVTIVPQIPTDRVVTELYGRTKVLLAPSDYESYGRVAAEAMCSGIPVIAHPTPGLLECLGDAGIFRDRDDLDGWCTEIRRLHTPRGFSASSRAAQARAAQLDPAEELERWRTSMEEVGRGATPARDR
jgi:glycosyltransferase involved in cell wall biosynthesis